MALVHAQQHSPRPAAPKEGRGELVQLSLLFLNLWGLLVVLPWLSTEQNLAEWSLLGAGLPVAVFVAGLVLQRKKPQSCEIAYAEMPHGNPSTAAHHSMTPSQTTWSSHLAGAVRWLRSRFPLANRSAGTTQAERTNKSEEVAYPQTRADERWPRAPVGSRPVAVLSALVRRYTGPPSGAALCWVLGVPAALAFSIGMERERSTWIALNWGVPGLLLCALSLWAYGAVAITQTVAAPKLAPTTVVPLTKKPRKAPDRGDLFKQRWVQLLYTGGGLVLAVVAPYLAAEQAFATGNRSGHPWALLAAVIGAGLGTTCTGLFLGSALTEARAQPPRKSAQIVPYLLLATLGAVTYYLISLKSWP